MSAPAMKPLFLAEATTSPRGGLCCNGRRRPSNSMSTPLERTFAEVSGLSSVSQTMPSASVSDFQEPPVLLFISNTPLWEASRNGRGRFLRSSAGTYVEVADERAMVREPHVGDTEVRDLDAFTHQDEVELGARHTRGKGGQACRI